jgi:MFS family permease
VSPVPVRQATRWTGYAELSGLYFLQSMASGMWLVPLSSVLKGGGLSVLIPYAFATTGAAAFFSPLIFGAVADRSRSPAIVLRWLAIAAAMTLFIVMAAIQRGWNPWLVLAWIQVQAFCAVPTSSIAAAIIFARLRNSQAEFGPVRVWATFGWMAGCWLISALNADASTRAGYADALVWLTLAAYTWILPAVEAPKAAGPVTLLQRLGWDTLGLLKNPDHRAVITTIALASLPLAAFYPFTPPQLSDLGFTHTTAWMTLGQVTEIVAMFSLAALLSKWRLKWIFAAGLGFGVLRFALCALNRPGAVLAGITLHGASLVLVVITAQVYVDQRVDPGWRARAQALVYLMSSGLGNFLGYLGTGWWLAACTTAGHAHWPMYWSGLSAAVAAVLLYFLTTYHGIKGRPIHR